MKLLAEPISKDAFRPFGILVAREREPGRIALSDLVTWNDPEARLVVEFSVREGTPPPVVVPGDLGIVYATNVWHFPMCALGTPGSFVMLMAKSGTGRDEEWASLPEAPEIDVP